MKTLILMAATLTVLFGSLTNGEENGTLAKKIDWYGTLDSGLAEAKRTNKPIFLLSAAPQCLGVPGIW